MVGFRRFSSIIRKSHFRAGYLEKREANFVQLSPISLFQRSVELYPSRLSYVYGNINRTWQEVGLRVSQFASALCAIGIDRGDVVSIVSPNTPAMFEAHFAVPGVRAVLHTVNTRLDATTIAFQLQHSNSKLVFVDSEFSSLMCEVVEKLKQNHRSYVIPRFINVFDREHYNSSHLTLVGSTDYESFIGRGDPTFQLKTCVDEWDAITLNYTSGTTGSPKGVVSHYRGAYLNAVGNRMEWNMGLFAKFLWVVPMFHCNGWCFPWTIASCGGTSYFLRQVRAEPMFDLIRRHKIEYMCAAPIIMNTLLIYPEKVRFAHTVRMWVAGSPPAPAVIRNFSETLNIQVQTAYGLTEVYGPISTYVEDPEWREKRGLTAEQLTDKLIVQCRDTMQEGLQVMDPDTMKPVPADGATMGEVMIRGNIVMKGYLGNEEATNECFKDGWFHTGDLAVSHGNGRIELKDRSKDIIISGGENISSVEVENIMMTHPALLEVAVVAMPDDKWQEVPCAFVTVKPGYQSVPTEQELIAWCRSQMAHYFAPKKIVFGDLPKTTTGKTQKNLLRKRIAEMLKEERRTEHS